LAQHLIDNPDDKLSIQEKHAAETIMKFTSIINSVIITIAAVFLIALAFRVNAGVTADSIAVLKTTGMTCGSCSSKITATLEAQKGVAVTEVDVEGGWVIVGYDTKTVTPEVLAQKVASTGFTSNVHLILTPEQFKQTTGRYPGNKTRPGSGCGGGKGAGCGAGKQS
jgi:mercuric ion binding protein